MRRYTFRWILVVLIASWMGACGRTEDGPGASGADGGDGSGGTATDGGTGGDGASDGGNGPGGGTGGTDPGGPPEGTATLGDECDSPGELACAGTFQKLSLVCGANHEWQVNQTCEGDLVCDTRAGMTRGTCQEQHPECLGREPGFRFCEGSAVRECGVDNVTADQVKMCLICEGGECQEDEEDERCPGESEEEEVVDCDNYDLDQDPEPLLDFCVAEPKAGCFVLPRTDHDVRMIFAKALDSGVPASEHRRRSSARRNDLSVRTT